MPVLIRLITSLDQNISPTAGSIQVRQRTAVAAAQAAVDVFEGRRPANIINPQVLANGLVQLDPIDGSATE